MPSFFLSFFRLLHLTYWGLVWFFVFVGVCAWTPWGTRAHTRQHGFQFTDVCAGQARFEVCRTFLAALQLANNGNIDILPTADSMALSLLSTQPVRPDLDGIHA